MKSTVERLEDSKVALTVEVPYEELQSAMDKAYKKLGSQVNIPGFRRGHVPKQILDRRIGRGYVIEEAVNDKLGEFYAKAIEEQDLIPMSSPDISVDETPSVTGKLEGRLVFVANVVCQPEFELPSIKGLELEVQSGDVTMDDVEKELENLRDRFSSLIGVDRPVEKGDYTSIDLVADIDGEEVEKTAGVSYQQGAGTMIPGLDDTLLGMQEGDTRSFDTEFVGGEYAGQKGTATVTVNKVKVKELPEADDDFAMMASEFDTIGELRKDLRTKLENAKRHTQGSEAVEKLREHLVETVDIKVPQSVVDQQLSDTPDELDAEEKQRIEDSIRTGVKAEIVMDKVARESGVKLGDNELLHTIMSAAQMYGVDPAQVLQSQEQVAGIAAQLTQNKALVLMLKDVSVKDTNGDPVDLTDFIAEAQQSDKKQKSGKGSDDNKTGAGEGGDGADVAGDATDDATADAPADSSDGDKDE